MCLHPSQVCDDIPQCPQQDDEVLCQSPCPQHCHCQGLSWVCDKKIDPQYFRTNTSGDIQENRIPVSSQPRYLDASHSGVDFSDVVALNMLVRLRLSHCDINNVSFSSHTSSTPSENNELIFPNLQYIDLSHNDIESVDLVDFLFLINLRVLILAHNPISQIINSAEFSTNVESVGDLNGINNMQAASNTTITSIISISDTVTFPKSSETLQLLDLSFTNFKLLNTLYLQSFPELRVFNISYSKVSTISTEGFKPIPMLERFYAKNTPLVRFPTDVLKPLDHLKSLTSENYKLCCPAFLPDDFDVNNCEATQDLLASCEDLLKSTYYRVFLWVFAALSLLGNITSFVARLYLDR